MSNILVSSIMSTSYNGLIIHHESMSPTAVTEGITMALIFLGSLTANSLALATILHDKVLRRNLHNWLILNLIINDLGFTVATMPFVTASVFDHGHFFIENKVFCLMNGTFAMIFAFGNFATVLAISVDRYLTIVWSARFPSSKIRTIVFIIICWVVPVVNAIPPSSGLLSGIKYHSNSHDCTADWEKDCAYFIICISILFGVNVPVMTFCYVGMFRNVGRQQRQLRSYKIKKNTETCFNDESVGDHMNKTDMSAVDIESSREGCASEDTSGTCHVLMSSTIVEHLGRNHQVEDTETTDGQEDIIMTEKAKKKNRRKYRSMQRKLTMEKRIALTGTLLVMTTVVCWAPYCIANPCLIVVNVPHWLSLGLVWLAYSNTLLDPLIYSFMNRRVRARYLALLARLPTRCQRRTE